MHDADHEHAEEVLAVVAALDALLEEILEGVDGLDEQGRHHAQEHAQADISRAAPADS